jgi:hypothetical protein
MEYFFKRNCRYPDQLMAVVRIELCWFESGYIVCCIIKIKDFILISRLAILSLVVSGGEINVIQL